LETLIVLFICLGLAYFGAEVFRRFKLPQVLGQITIGLLIGIPVIKNSFFSSTDLNLISFLADIGLILLLFFVGLKIDIKAFIRLSKRASLVSIFGFLVPFVFGFVVAKLVGLSTMTATIISLCLSVSAEAVAIEILEEMGKLKSNVGEIIIEAGVIDDAIAVLILGVVVAILSGKNASVAGSIVTIITEILIFSIIIMIARFIILPWLWKYVEKEHSEINEFTAALLIGLLIAIIAKLFGLSSVIGAVIAGVIVRQILIKSSKKGLLEEKRITKVIEIMTFGFIAPFFFIWIGLNTNLRIMWTFPLFGLALIFIGFSGKLLGCKFGNYLAKGTAYEGNLIAWAMNTRGAVELMVAEIARSQGLLSNEMFSGLIFMAFVTTIISPIVFEYLVRKHKHKIKKKKRS